MSVPPASSTVLSFEDACRVVEEQAALVASHASWPDLREPVDLLAAAGRVLAESVSADRDLPPFPRSTRDGYAVRSADLSQLPATLDVIGEIKAGEKLDKIPSADRQRASGGHHDRSAGSRGCGRGGDGRIHVAARATGRNRAGRCSWREHCSSRRRGPRGRAFARARSAPE